MFIGTPNCFNKKTLNLAENAVERQDEKDRAMPMHGRSSVKQIKKTQNRRQHGPCFLCLVLVYTTIHYQSDWYSCPERERRKKLLRMRK